MTAMRTLNMRKTSLLIYRVVLSLNKDQTTSYSGHQGMHRIYDGFSLHLQAKKVTQGANSARPRGARWPYVLAGVIFASSAIYDTSERGDLHETYALSAVKMCNASFNIVQRD